MSEGQDLRPVLERVWLVCWHPKADTLQLFPVRELLDFNALHMRRNEAGYMVVAICPSMEKASEVKREKMRMIRELRGENGMAESVGGEG